MFFNDLETASDNALTHEINQEYEPTHIDVTMASSETSLTDVVAYDRYYVDYCEQNWTGRLG